MKLLVKLFIYCTIIVIIGAIVQAKPSGGMGDLMRMEEVPEKAPEFESSQYRIRRDAPPEEVPKEAQHNPKQMRVKRQMPPPPEGMPMPPM